MKITVYILTADTARDGSFCHAFASDAERDAWAWENIVAQNLKENDHLANGTMETLEAVKDVYSTALSAIHEGERKGYDDSIWFFDNEIEIPSQKIKLYTVQGEHFSNPGHIMKHFTDKQAATAEAVDLVNIMLADSGWQKLASPLQWEHHLTRLQDEHGAQYCDVWIDETEIEVPAPEAKPTKYVAAIDDDCGIALETFDSESARDEYLWNLAWKHDQIDGVKTVQQYMEHYDDIDDAMLESGIGYVTEEY